MPARRNTPTLLHALALTLAMTQAACGDDIDRETDSGGLAITGAGGSITSSGGGSSSGVDSMSGTTGDTGDGTSSTGSTTTTTSTTSSSTSSSSDATVDPDPPSLQDCGFQSDSFGAGLKQLDVPLGSPEKLVFTVQGLPPPAVIESATLRFDSHDADHPGEEGVIWVNGSGPYDLPADASWDNQDGTGAVDVTGATVEGSNTIEFGAGSLGTGSYYFIGNVVLEVAAIVTECPEPPPPAPIERTVWYQDATYTKRHNWVLRCNDYAFTAKGDEHIPDDCDGLYEPDLSRTGTATFAFPGLPEANYEIQIRSRHTENRNPAGALFVVDGEGKRINQRDDKNYTTDIWGTKQLGGDVDVVLDSTMENESDSVIWVKLVPAP